MKKVKQFEEDPEIAARVEKLKRITADYDRAHVLLWEVAEACLDMHRDDERLKYAVLKWRKYCHHELRIETWAIPGVGIKLLTQSEQVRMLPQKRAKKAYRQHGLILRSIKNTDVDSLSEHERRMARAITEHSRDARKQTNKISNTTRGKIPNDRQALIDRARAAGAEQESS
jgi:phage regulator Rha-like protein